MNDEQDTSAEVIDQITAAQQREATAAAVAAMKSPLDRALSKPSPRPAALPQTLRMPNAPTMPSLALRPENIASLPEYDDSTRGYVAGTETAMSTMHEAVASVIEMREAAGRNPSWTEAMGVIQVSIEAGKRQDAAARAADSARAALDKGINSIQAELRAPVQAVTQTPLSGEIAAHCRSLPDGERMSFLTTAIAEKDEVTMRAILSRPPYLVGLSKDMLGVITERWHRACNPETARKLALMQGAKDKLDAAHGLFNQQIEDALGVRGGWATAQRLREQQSSAMKAFKSA